MATLTNLEDFIKRFETWEPTKKANFSDLLELAKAIQADTGVTNPPNGQHFNKGRVE